MNDKYGHAVGDEVLIAIAEVLQKVKKDNDIVMRLGGDEFAAYFVDILSKETAAEMINRFFDSIYRIADGGVYDSKSNKGSSYTFRG